MSANNYNDEALLIVERQKRPILLSLISLPFLILLLIFYFEVPMTPIMVITNPATLIMLAAALLFIGLPLAGFFTKKRVAFYEDYVIVGRGNRQKKLSYDSLVLGARGLELLYNKRDYAFKIGIKGEGKRSAITLFDQVVPKIGAPSLYNWLENQKALEYIDDLRLNKKTTLEQSRRYVREIKLMMKIMLIASIPAFLMGTIILVVIYPPPSSPLATIGIFLAGAGLASLVFGAVGYAFAKGAKPMPRDAKGNPIWEKED